MDGRHPPAKVKEPGLKEGQELRQKIKGKKLVIQVNSSN